MPRKKTKKELLKQEYVKISGLVELTDARYSTIKYWTELGLLPLKEVEAGFANRYPTQEAIKRVKEIQALREKNKSIPEVINKFRK